MEVNASEEVKTESRKLFLSPNRRGRWHVPRIEYGENWCVFVPEESMEGVLFELPTLGLLIPNRSYEFDPNTGLPRSTEKKPDLSD